LPSRENSGSVLGCLDVAHRLVEVAKPWWLPVRAAAVREMADVRAVLENNARDAIVYVVLLEKLGDR